MTLVTAFGLFVLALGTPSRVIPTEQATLFGDAIVAHGTGDGAWFPLMDTVLVVEDGERPVQMCATQRYIAHDYAYELRRAVEDNNLELVSCVPGGVMFTELREC